MWKFSAEGKADTLFYAFERSLPSYTQYYAGEFIGNRPDQGGFFADVCA